MPRRRLQFENGKYYHIFDKGKGGTQIADSQKDFIRLLKTFGFYHYENPGIKLSRLLAMNDESQSNFIEQLKIKNDLLVEIIVFSLLPHSINMILMQKKDNGISNFLSQILNSYTRYLDSKRNTKGSVFVDSFKAKEITADNLLPLSRHIHLLPVMKREVDISELSEHPWSSFWEYTHPDYESLSVKEHVLQHFSQDSEGYKNYVENIEDYKNTLPEIKKLIFK